MKSKLETYALAVCFLSVVCLIVSSGFAGYAGFQVLYPELTMSSNKYEKYSSNEAFWGSEEPCYTSRFEEKPAEEAISRNRLAALEQELKIETRDGVQSLIKCLMFILASSAAIAIHWKLARSSKE